MKRVQREDILPLEQYSQERAALRSSALLVKNARRIHLGNHLTFLFETFETMRYQIQEMLRVEGREDEASIAHELKTYNELLGKAGELGCTLLIEIEDVLQRDIVLRKWVQLPKYLYLKLEDGRLSRAQYDERQVGDERLSSVQYLKFDCGESAPVAIGVDMPDMELEVPLSTTQQAALKEDLCIGGD